MFEQRISIEIFRATTKNCGRAVSVSEPPGEISFKGPGHHS